MSHFTVKDSKPLMSFLLVYNQPGWLALKMLITSEQFPCAFSKPLAVAVSSGPHLCLLQMSRTNGVLQPLAFCACLLSLNTMLSTFIHVMTHVNIPLPCGEGSTCMCMFVRVCECGGWRSTAGYLSQSLCSPSKFSETVPHQT